MALPDDNITAQQVDEEETMGGSGEFEELFNESLRQFQSGELIKGVVVKVDQDTVLVDIGHKSEGRINAAEFLDEQGNMTVKVGDEVSVLLERGEDEKGLLILSRRKAERQAIWESIAAAGGEGGTIEGKIVAKVKGGMTVDIGLPAFLPASQVDLRPTANLDKYLGQTYTFKILKLNKKRGNVVLSRRVLMEEDRESQRDKTLGILAEGQIVDGVVKNITDYGAFLDLGGIDGLLHVTDMSWGRLAHPSEAIKVGDQLKVMVLKYDRNKGKISLGLKQALPDPWLDVEGKFPVGAKVSGKVVSLTEYGAFVALEEGVEGLIHVSEMSWTKRVRHPSDILTVGDEVEVLVLGMDLGNRRISLGLKQVTANPWTEILERYPVGTKIEGQIKNVTDFGVFIGVEEGIDGLVHVSDISWTRRIKHPGELFSKGQTVLAVVLNIDPENERLSLGMKQLTPDPWTEIPVKYRPGTKLKGKVTSVTEFGIFLEIEEGIEGLIHVSELSREKVPTPKGFANVGDELEALVLNIDTVEKKISLSVKALQAATEKAEMSSYMDTAPGEGLGNFGSLLEGLKKNSEE